MNEIREFFLTAYKVYTAQSDPVDLNTYRRCKTREDQQRQYQERQDDWEQRNTETVHGSSK